jgi:hypothetical protein
MERTGHWQRVFRANANSVSQLIFWVIKIVAAATTLLGGLLKPIYMSFSK